MTTLTLEIPTSLHRQLERLATHEGVTLDKFVIYSLSRQISMQDVPLPRRVLINNVRQQRAAFQSYIADAEDISIDKFDAILAEGESADPDPEYTPDLQAAFQKKISDAAHL